MADGTTSQTAQAPAQSSDVKVGWSARDIGGLVFVGILITVLWLLFRRLKLDDGK